MDSESRTLRSIFKELVNNPFFPILFLGEFVKELVVGGSSVVEFGVLAGIATLLWVFSDLFTWKVIKQRVIGINGEDDTKK